MPEWAGGHPSASRRQLFVSWKWHCGPSVRADCRRTRKVKLLRTIRLDASDSFVFEKPAQPGEWAVSGAFAFAHGDPANLRGKARTAFRAGFLGLGSLGRSTLVQIVEANEGERGAVVGLLAAQLAKRLGAPALATASLAAAEGASFAASLC